MQKLKMGDLDLNIEVELPVEVEVEEEEEETSKSDSTTWVLGGIIVALVVTGLIIGGFFWFRSKPAKVGWTSVADGVALAAMAKTEYTLPQVNMPSLSMDQQHFVKEFYTAASSLQSRYSLANVNRLYFTAEQVTAKPNLRINCPNFSCEGIAEELESRKIPISGKIRVGLTSCCRNLSLSTKGGKNAFAKDAMDSCLKNMNAFTELKVAQIIGAIDFTPVKPDEKCESFQN